MENFVVNSNINETSKEARAYELELLQKLRAREDLSPDDWDLLDFDYAYDTEFCEACGHGYISWNCVAKLINENNEPEYWMYGKITSDYEGTEYEGPPARVYPREVKTIVWEDTP